MSLADVGADMSTLMTDLRVAVRMLWKDRRFTLVALVALAIGIGATSAIYTVIDSVLLRPLPLPEPNALVEIQSARAQRGRAELVRRLRRLSRAQPLAREHDGVFSIRR